MAFWNHLAVVDIYPLQPPVFACRLVWSATLLLPLCLNRLCYQPSVCVHLLYVGTLTGKMLQFCMRMKIASIPQKFRRPLTSVRYCKGLYFCKFPVSPTSTFAPRFLSHTQIAESFTVLCSFVSHSLHQMSKSIDTLFWNSLGKRAPLLFGEECGSAALWTFLALIQRCILILLRLEAFIPSGFIFAFPIIIQVIHTNNVL